MRITAFLILSLAIVAFRIQTTASRQSPALATHSAEQTINTLFQSADGGKTWEDLNIKLPEDTQVTSVLTQGEEVFLGADNGTVYRSNNSGSGFWERAVLEGRKTSFEVTGIFSGQSGPYASVYKDGFYKQVAGTNHWQAMHSALPDKIVHTVVENPDGSIVVCCPTGIYKTVDEGKTWSHVYSEGWVTSLAGSGGNMVGSSSLGLLRSADNGDHWECVLTDTGAVYQTSVINDRFAAIRVAGPVNSSVDILLRTSTSADGGKTWQRMGGLSPARNWLAKDQGMSPVQAIYDLIQAGQYLYCSHRGGVSRSADGGKTWDLVHPITATTNNNMPTRLKLSVSGQRIFAVAMRGGGC